MPYIENKLRQRLTPNVCPLTEGELNYAITKLCLKWLDGFRPGQSYRHLNTIIGALECAKLEFYRRMVGPYEDKKKKENGEVYS